MWRNVPGYKSTLVIFTIAQVISMCSSSQIQGYKLLDSIKSPTPYKAQQRAVDNLIQRLLPGRESEFNVSIDSSIGPSDRDTFMLQTGSDGRLHITDSSGVAAALGLNVYLKEYAHCQVAWSSRQLNVAKPLPRVPAGGVKRTTNDRFHYNSNVCTFGYTYVWWNWTRWEQEIDWMVLNGINIPLAFTGQEAILQQVFVALGVNSTDLLEKWFTGPAFLPWFRMGNLIKWGGPLSQEYIDNQVVLQHRILDRMRSFGMLPILPAFPGHVPAAITRLFPNADITKLSLWSKFDSKYSGTYYLNPTDPLYRKIGQLFIQYYTKEFGTDHLYNIDPWNEMTPSESTIDYIATASSSIMSSLKSHDPKAIWVVQGWMFSHDSTFWTMDRAKAFLTAVPRGEMLVLDLAAEYEPMYSKLESFYGQPFIWCMINNYGGRMGLFGHITSVNQNVFTARSYTNSTMMGTGLTMEGTGTNYIVYELMNEMHYRKQSVNLYNWISDYTRRRYGFSDDNLSHVWYNLVNTAYNSSAEGQEIIIRRPTWKMRDTAFPAYNTSSLYNSIVYLNKALQNATKQYFTSELLSHDIVDVWRETLYVRISEYYLGLKTSISNKDLDKYREFRQLFSFALTDMDTLMRSHRSYLLGRWVESAEALATTQSDKELFRYNAINQVTLWGPDGEISDYAGKQWADLISQYYWKRWDLFLQDMEKSLKRGEPFDEAKFRENLFKQVEKPFSQNLTHYTTQPDGDTIQIARDLYLSQTAVTMTVNPQSCSDMTSCLPLNKWLSSAFRPLPMLYLSKTEVKIL